MGNLLGRNLRRRVLSLTICVYGRASLPSGYLCSGRQPLLLPLSVVSYINALKRMVSSLPLRLQVSAIEKAMFGHGSDCDLGFCLGPRLGDGRGPPVADKFCVPHLRKI